MAYKIMAKKVADLTFKIKKITNGFVVVFKKGSKVLEKSYCSNLFYVKELITKQPSTMADSLGNFRIEYLEPNKNYVIEISAFGYGNQKFDVKTKSGINNVTFELKAECGYSAERAESDWKNGKASLLLFGSIAPIANSPADKRFEKKYGIRYYDFGCTPPISECIKEYNERIFKLMDEKYGMKWRNKVRSDVEYLN